MAHKSKIRLVSDDEFRNIVKNNNCISSIVEYFGYSKASGSMAKIVKERINELNIDTSHFKPFARTNQKSKYGIDEILVQNSSYMNIDRLKKRIISNNLIEYKCSECGNTGGWNGKKLSLQLHHKNGIHNDHRLENLTFLCPNCHSQTENYSGKNATW